ncbi:transcription factor bHLH113 [Prosopis cineraria]|uniref:transcription factor bHLH113 n=1 Tax=Prosopis cineraria TaxID=364024 RepID=UPI00240F8A5D|nr:transcription factor bHLH113 [Prosopis cineraria]
MSRLLSATPSSSLTLRLSSPITPFSLFLSLLRCGFLIMEDDHHHHQHFHGDHLLSPAPSFSQLLLADHHVDPSLHSSSLFSVANGNTPTMLCFQTYPNNPPDLFLSDPKPVTPHKSVITSSESSSASSSCNHESQKKRSGSGQELAGCTDSVVTAAGGGGRRQSKKARAENPASTGHAKRKEKLGERIAALQQLVSPFGKTDTASVLHEAMGYIRFLHDQVQVLCSPYLQGLPSSPHLVHAHPVRPIPYHHHYQGVGFEINARDREARGELSSRGLCLIPVESTVHVARSNGADFWSPAMGNHNVSPPT